MFRYYRIILLFILLAKISFPQHVSLGIYSEYNVIPINNDSLELFYSFRIANSLLVFEKTTKGFEASFQINVEITDSTSKFVKREFEQRKLITQNFEETNSSEIFTEVLLKFYIPNEKLNLFPSFSDLKSNREIKLRNHILFKTDFSKYRIFNPIIVRKMESGENYALVNYDSSIPYDNNSYTMLFPVTDFLIDTLIITIESSLDTLHFVLKNYSDSKINLELNEEIKIALNENDNRKTRNFILENFSTKFSEDKLKIKVETNLRKTPIVFHKEVKWINKPKSLHNIEFAIKMLNYIEDENVVASIKKAKNEIIALYSYWEKYDPSKSTKYNELMYEFYTRVDYAVNNFTTVGVKNGAESDRGKVFIVYGEPTEIARINNNLGKVSEIWSYQKLGKTFTFIDKSGTGKFDLVEVK